MQVEGFLPIEGTSYWVSATVWHDRGCGPGWDTAGEPEQWGIDGIEQLETEEHDVATDAPVDALPRYEADPAFADAVDRAILERAARDD